MKISTLIILTIISSSFVFGQNWMHVGLGAYNYGIKKLYTDTVNNILYASGNFKLNANDTIKGIAKWTGTNWDSLNSGLNELPEAIIYYNGKLFVGGRFTKVDNIDAINIATWNGIKWDSIGHGMSSAVFDFHEYNNELYVGGMFSPVDTTNSKAIAKRNSNSWYSLGNPIWTLVQVKAIQNYKNEIYVGGFFDEDDSPNILRWNNNQWNAVDNGIKGSSSFDAPVNKMLIYKQELYIAGNFKKQDGNKGNNIMKWDGNRYIDISNGVNGEVRDMVVFNKELYVVGSFQKADTIFANNIVKWDGLNWCSLGSNFNYPINTIEVYNNQLYIGGTFTQIDGQPYNYIAKWIGDNNTSVCTTNIAIKKEVTNTLNLFPNPFTNDITLQIPTDYILNDTKISIINTLGQLMLTIYPTNYNQLINTSTLASSMYYLTLSNNTNKKTVKIIKQ